MTDQEVQANDWQNDHKLIKEKVGYLLESGMLYDCEFIVGIKPNQQELKGHKLILAMSSPVFEAMFYGGIAEQGQVTIPDIKPKIFRKILKYIYRETLNLKSLDEACDVYNGAKKYLLFHLAEECVEFIISILTPSIACRVYEYAKYVDEPKLEEKCIKLFVEKTEEVLKEDDFEEATLNTVVTIFKREDLKISSELILFSALQRWIRRDNSRKEPKSNGLSYKDALKCIKFWDMNSNEFTQGPANSDLLKAEEKVAIYRNICSKNSKEHPMPAGLSQPEISRKKIQNAGIQTTQSYNSRSDHY